MIIDSVENRFMEQTLAERYFYHPARRHGVKRAIMTSRSYDVIDMLIPMGFILILFGIPVTFDRLVIYSSIDLTSSPRSPTEFVDYRV